MSPAAPARYHALTALRGLLALGVVIHHAIRMDMGARYGRVVLFFVVSGYCIFQAVSTGIGKGPREAGRFWWRRVVRLWPTLACALVYLMCMRWVMGYKGAGYRPHQSAWAWVQNLTFSNWVSMLGESGEPPWKNRTLLVATHWTLGYEAQFYVLIGLVLAASVLVKVRLVWVAWGLTLVGAGYVFALPATWTATLLDYSVYFGIGGLVWAALCRNAGMRLRLGAGATIAAIACGAGFMLLRLSSSPLPPDSMDLDPSTLDRARDWYEALLVGALGGLALMAAYPLDKRWRTLAIAKPLTMLGTISYSLFLVHAINAPLVRELTERALPANPPAGAWLGVFVLLQVGMAAGFWWVCERPFGRGRRMAGEAGRALP